jgi:hypothetical protein
MARPRRRRLLHHRPPEASSIPLFQSVVSVYTGSFTISAAGVSVSANGVSTLFFTRPWRPPGGEAGGHVALAPNSNAYLNFAFLPGVPGPLNDWSKYHGDNYGSFQVREWG